MADVFVLGTKLVVATAEADGTQVEAEILPEPNVCALHLVEEDDGFFGYIGRETLRDFCRATLTALDATE